MWEERQLLSKVAMVSTYPSPRRLVPPFFCCLKEKGSQNKGFNVKSLLTLLIQHSTVGLGKIPHALLVLRRLHLPEQ